jgi:hypothetical protein
LEVFIFDEEPGTKTFKNPKGTKGESLLPSDTLRAAPLTRLQDDVAQLRRARESVASGDLSVGVVRISIGYCILMVFTTTTMQREIFICQSKTVVFALVTICLFILLSLHFHLRHPKNCVPRPSFQLKMNIW